MSYKTYTKEFEVHHYEANKFNYATPVSILNYLGETASCHSESVGLGVDYLTSEEAVWILNRWHLIMNKYPKSTDKIIVETWASNFERFYGTREFLIKDTYGNDLGKASSLWIYFNTNKRRPYRIPEKIGDMYTINMVKAIDNPFKELSVPEEPEVSKNFQVRKYDIDTNNHVNNVKYLEWIIESIPDCIYEKCFLSEFEIEYKKEVTYGMDVSSNFKSINSEDNDTCYIHSITSSENKTEHAAAHTKWIRL